MSLFACFSVRLVLKIVGDYCIVILISFGQPLEGFDVLIFGYLIRIPYRMVVAGSIGVGRMDVDHYLHAVLFAKSENVIKDLERIERIQISVICVIIIRGRIIAFLPLEKKLCGHGNTQEIESVVCDSLY